MKSSVFERKWYSANMRFPKHTRRGKAINFLKSYIMSRGRDAINFGSCTMDCKFAEMSSRNCELSTVKCELGAVNWCFAESLPISPSHETLEPILHPFGRLLTPLGSQLEASSSRQPLEPPWEEAPGRQYVFRSQNP